MVPGPTNEAAFLVVPRWKSMSLGRAMLGLGGRCRGRGRRGWPWPAWLVWFGCSQQANAKLAATLLRASMRRSTKRRV